RFGAVLWSKKPIAEHKLLSHLGPEPLSSAFDGDWLFEQSHKRKSAVKNFIMNGKNVVGVGNIYASESLFMAGIHPQRAANRISRDRYGRLAGSIKQILAQAIKQGGTTLRDFQNADGNPGYFDQQLQVYGRQGAPCPQCKKPVSRKIIGQRASYFCSHCQH
ncbi:MAG: bifunctional DNA-formamidopyrimidine glycosylase/DNA-(apurinic or apyrimidinic site) lyase, partial [Gammaproteobacteria bacterium]|nr:bifunctional DNA-formamidopyrimidine glycosylase/DNA-(apurinic or apyrimidinic site) lyase [Gammaproteobacteria bacterium]